MAFDGRTIGVLVAGAMISSGLAVLANASTPSAGSGSTVSPVEPSRSSTTPMFAQGQEQAPTRREFTLTAKDFRFSPDRIEVARDDIVKLTVRSQDDVSYSLTIDEYRVSKRVPAGGAVTFEFRADREGTFPFYSNMTGDARHSQARGQLVVRAR